MPITQEFTLAELVDLALCTPEKGAVNFNILQNLLHGILKHTGLEAVGLEVTLQEVETEDSAFSDTSEDEVASDPSGIKAPKPDSAPSSDPSGSTAPKPDYASSVSMKVISKAADYGLEPAKKHKIVSSIWKAKNIQSRMDAAEEGMERVTHVIDGVIEDHDEFRRHFEEHMKKMKSMVEGFKVPPPKDDTKLKNQVDGNTKKIAELEKTMKDLESKTKGMVDAQEFKKLKAKLDELVPKDTFTKKTDDLQKQIKDVGEKIPKEELTEIKSTLKVIKPKAEAAVSKEIFGKSVEKQETKNRDLESQILSLGGSSTSGSDIIGDHEIRLKNLEDKVGGLDEGAGDHDVRLLTEELTQQVAFLKQRLDALSKEIESMAHQVKMILERMGLEGPPEDKEAMLELYIKLKQMQEKIDGLGRAASGLLRDHAEKKRNIIAMQKELDMCTEAERSAPVELASGNLLKSKVACRAGAKTQMFSKELQEMLARLASNELDWMRTVREIGADVENTLGHLDLGCLEDRLQDRFTFIMARMKDLQGPEARFEQNPLELEAANIMRKPLPKQEPILSESELYLPTFPVPLDDPRPKKSQSPHRRKGSQSPHRSH